MRTTYSENILNTIFLINKPCWSPINAYLDTQDKPHIMFTMRHDIVEREELLRGEVLAISAAIWSRLQATEGSVAEHIYVPLGSTLWFHYIC